MPRHESAPPLRFAHEMEMGAESMRLVAGTDDDMKRINKLALKEITRDEVAIFRLDLVNNSVDRHDSRFPEKELETINSMIVKKPLMEVHQTRTRLPRGRFINSRITVGARS